jgi:dUTPase
MSDNDHYYYNMLTFITSKYFEVRSTEVRSRYTSEIPTGICSRIKRTALTMTDFRSGTANRKRNYASTASGWMDSSHSEQPAKAAIFNYR